MIGTTQVKCEKRKLAYRRSVWRLPPVPSSLLFIALLVFFPDSAFSAPDRISKKALDEIGALFEEKAAWTPAQKKLESQLIHALKRNRGEAFAPRVPNLRLDVEIRADGRVLVDIRAKVTPELLALIRRDGGQVINNVPRFRAIRALVSLGQLEQLARSDDVAFIRRAVPFLTNTGSVDTQGDITHRAAAARSDFGASGGGVKVGVLSDSVDYLVNSQASGDLGDVMILPGQSGAPGTGEGTAMLEIIHDIAPDAQLYFATADGGPAVFAQNILNLRTTGCDIIVDDVLYADESPFQDGIVAQAVNSVTADGALYFSAAGNAGSIDADSSGTWEGDFLDGGPLSAPLAGPGRLHSFGSFGFNTAAAAGKWVILFWADPLGASANDYDLFVLDSTGSSIIRSSMTRQDGTQDPGEGILTLNAGERIVITKYSGEGRFLHLSTGGGRLTIGTAGATLGHSSSTNAMSVAATPAYTSFGANCPEGPYPNSFVGGAANQVECFSSDGPRRVFFNSDGTAITPGDFSSSGGAIRQKPDITAADGVSTAVPGFQPFFGTSAAAPHAAAIAALVLSLNHSLTAGQVRTALTSKALDIGPPGVDRDSGAGIVMAYQILRTASGLAQVALYGAETDYNNADVKAKIVASGLLHPFQIDVFRVGNDLPIPTLADLRQYNAVLVYSNDRYTDAASLGNALADYADLGGGVLIATHSFSADGFSGLGGRIMTSAYSPFAAGAPRFSSHLSLVKDLPDHALVQNVSALNGGVQSTRDAVTLTAGATLVAHWSDGTPLLATVEPAGSRVVGLNFWPPSSDSDYFGWQVGTDGGRLMANALLWAAASELRAPVIPCSETRISFDDLIAPTDFPETTRLTNRYNAQGVTFAGPGGRDGGAILSDNSNFRVTGYSLRNFLAFNTAGLLSDGGIPRGPETITFAAPMASVRVLAGTGLDPGHTVTMRAYDANQVLLASSSITLSAQMAPLQVSGNGIQSVVVSTTSPTLVLDDLVFVPACAQPQIMAGTIHRLSGGQCGFAVSGRMGATYEIQVSSDLRNWSRLTSLTMTNTTTDFMDTGTNAVLRFYRASLMP